MRSLWRFALLPAVVLLPAAGAGPRLQFEETSNLRLVYYSPTHAYLLPHLIRCFENAYGFHRKALGL